MLYHIARNGQMYGPYTKEDLQRYVASGNVLMSDLAKSDEMAEWISVSQVLGAEPTAAPSGYAPVAGASYTPVSQSYAISSTYPQTGAQPGAYPDPPNLSWVLVLVFGILTCGIFTIVYDFIQAAWVKKVVPSSKVLIYYIVFIGLEILSQSSSFSRMFLFSQGIYSRHLHGPSLVGSLFSGTFGLAAFALVLLYRFTMRGELEAHFNGPEPIGLQLSGIMTFFFGGIYFQYHFNRINAIKAAARYGAPRPY